MGDLNNHASNDWIDARLITPVSLDLKESVGRAVFAMSGLLETAAHPEHSVVSEHVDIVLLPYMEDPEDRSQGRRVLDLFQTDWVDGKPKDLFLRLVQLTKANIHQISRRLEDLMEPTMVAVTDSDAEDEDGSIVGKPTVRELLATKWGLGQEITDLLFDAETKAEKTRANLVLMELYLLVILRFLQLQFGEVEEARSDEEDPTQFVTVRALNVAMNTMRGDLRDELLAGMSDLLEGRPVISKRPSKKAVVAAASSRKRASARAAMRDSDGSSSGESGSGRSEDHSGSDGDELDSVAERRKIRKGLSKLQGKGPSLRGESQSLVVSLASRGSTAHYLFNNEPVPQVVRTAVKESRATFFKGTMKSLLDSSCATWSEMSTEVSLSTIMAAVTSEFGLLIMDMRGVPHSFKSSATKKRDPVLRCTILNPDANEELTAMSMQSVSEYLFPLTDNHFDRNLDDQREKAMEPSFIKFLHPPVARVKHLGLYARKFRALRQAHLWNRSTIPNTQANHFHITTWCVLLLFHINIWMKAMMRKDTSILVDEFDTVWQAFYADRLRHGEPPKIPFRMVLILCEYRHDKCKSPGTSILYCAICGVNASRSNGGGGGEETPAVKQFYKAFRAWKLTVKGDDKSVAKYLSLHPNMKKPDESSTKVSSSAISVSTSSGVEAHVASQHRIMLHDSFEL
jgi:hypothetical protein